MNTSVAFKPTTNAERIQIIDILRGFAIWGILMVHINSYAGANPLLQPGPINHTLREFIVYSFFVNKFYSLFSLLFGLGMAIQMKRAEDKQVPFVRLYLRRLFWLAVFGVLNQVLLFDGDILLVYAVLALVALPLRKLKPRALLIIGVTVIGLRAVLMSTITFLDYQPQAAARDAEQREADLAATNETYASGTYAEVTTQRIEDWWVMQVTAMVGALGEASPWLYLLSPILILILMGDIVALFLIGIAVGKLGWLHDVEAHLPIWRRLFWWCFPIGLIIQVGSGIANIVMDSTAVVWPAVIEDFALATASVLTVGMTAGLVLLSRRATWLNVFAPAGRMALTNYLAQSLIFPLIFYGYGLGLYGSLGILALLLATLAVGLQVAFSYWWMKRFRFGPFEWLWRSLTYGRLQPMRVSALAGV